MVVQPAQHTGYGKMQAEGVDAPAELVGLAVHAVENRIVVGIVDLKKEGELLGDGHEVGNLLLGAEAATIPIHDVTEPVDTHLAGRQPAGCHAEQVGHEADVLAGGHPVPSVGYAVDFSFIYKFNVFHGSMMILSSGWL